MRNGQPGDPYLTFLAPTTGLLMAAVGIEPNGDTPLVAELNMWRNNFNLANGHVSVDGIREASQDPDTNPEISVSIGSQNFYGTGSESAALGSVAADGPGGQVLTTHFTVSNVGFAPMTITAASFLGQHSGFSVVTAGLVGTTLQPNQSEVLTVLFDPSVAGDATGTLDVETNAGYAPSFELSLSALGIPFAPTGRVSLGGNNNLAGVKVGDTTLVSGFATITNDGVQPLKISSIGVAGGNSRFEVTGLPTNLATQPIMLAPGKASSSG